MIVSVSDILKTLEKIPEWIGLKRLLGRVDVLERRVTALEGKLAEATRPPSAEACALCHGAMRVTTARPHPEFGIFGVELRTLTCEACGHQAQRNFDPTKD